MSIFKLARRVVRQLFHPEDFFLRHVSGIIRVGSPSGKEHELYSEYGLTVLWIEANPTNFQTLTTILQNYARQTAVSYLLADVDNKDCTLRASSDSTGEISLKSIKLSSMVAREKVDMSLYDALVIDTQGSELLVLKGADDLLSRFKFIKTEATDFEVYKGNGTVKDIDAFLTGRSFRLVSKKPFTSKSGVGSCYDLIYSRESWKKLRSKN